MKIKLEYVLLGRASNKGLHQRITFKFDKEEAGKVGYFYKLVAKEPLVWFHAHPLARKIVFTSVRRNLLTTKQFKEVITQTKDIYASLFAKKAGVIDKKVVRKNARRKKSDKL
jgi:hypothetical protein